MNLSGVSNLPELNRSQGAGQTQASQNSTVVSTSTSASAEPNGGKTDQTSFSASGLAAALAAPEGSVSDVRTDKVASVSAAIQAGTYNVSPLDVADKIIQGLFDSNQR